MTIFLCWQEVGFTKAERNFAEGNDIPLGLGMALSQNIDAMNRFAALSEMEKQDIIARTHSKKEMQAYVQGLFR